MILSALGGPESDALSMLVPTQNPFGGEDLDFGSGREKALVSVLRDMMQHFHPVPSDRHARPQSDLASAIANAPLDSEPLGALRTLWYYTIIATTGHETTASSPGRRSAAFLQHPEQFRALRDDPSLPDTSIIDEMIRRGSLVHHVLQTVQQDYLLMNGTPLQTDAVLLLSYLSANRDEAALPEPDRLDIRRKNAADPLAFGLRVHFCSGVHLARNESLQESLSRLGSIVPNRTARVLSNSVCRRSLGTSRLAAEFVRFRNLR